MAVPARGAGWREAVCAIALLAALMKTAGPLRAEPAVPLLSDIPVDAGAVPAAAGGILRLRVQAADVAGLATLLGIAPEAGPRSGHIELLLQPGTHAAKGATGDALAASFVVDHKDPAVANLGARLQAKRLGTTVPVDGAELVAFVAGVMRGSYNANTDIASDVARSLQGDCSEYALLTAALARAHGLPARLVQGAALLQSNGRWIAYGHAWVQTFEAGGWVVRDSALAAWSGPVYYLPALVLSNEGPGFKLEVMQSASRMPSRIEILAPASPPSP
ncbi:transglutaminase domain-containing protein [Silanimonas sp.]|jgi:hypothetical protein|uniref:transglutaminase domain-containing protein n=1 Tax=Silanimonas sp. TaxID=1929290 RepID=UPI0022C27981|nr:transglutaminase domain-containing protein [Silanimonas sp.]MCZ8167301.1 transglutaminase domain-containing protein [Silanimonas sp.]